MQWNGSRYRALHTKVEDKYISPQETDDYTQMWGKDKIKDRILPNLTLTFDFHLCYLTELNKF